MIGKYIIAYQKKNEEHDTSVKVPFRYDNVAAAAEFGLRLIRYKLFTCFEKLTVFRHEPGVYAYLVTEDGLILARLYKTESSFAWRYTKPLELPENQREQLVNELKGV